MGKIVILDNPMDPSQRREYFHTGPLINWLTAHYPDGFGQPHVAAFNTQYLPVADYDRPLGERDAVFIGIAPALPAGIIVGWGAFFMTYVAPALISMALSYIANSIFGKSGSSGSKGAGKGMPDPSPTYSLSVPTNTARLGQPIPVIYGHVRTTPDLAAHPYTWFENNDMYAGLMFCLGQGWHTVAEMRVADTPLQQLASGTASYRVFSPDDHQQTFGIIQSAMGIYENVYTSPEVADQELDADRTDDDEGCYWVYSNSIDCENNRFHIDYTSNRPIIECVGEMPEAMPIPDCVAVGQSVTITNAGTNNGTYTISAFLRYQAGAWLELSPPLQCDPFGASFNVNRAIFYAPGCLVTDCTQVLRLYECETGSWVGGDCSQHPISSDSVGSTITLSWQRPTGLPGNYESFILSGRVTAVSRQSGFSEQYVDVTITDYDLTRDPPVADPAWCDTGGAGDDPGGTSCPEVTDIDVTLVAQEERPQIIFECGGEGGGEVPTCGEYSIGPFVACNPGWKTEKLQLDILFPYGLYKAGEDGNLEVETCSILFTAYEVDDDGLAIGGSHEKTATFTAASNTPQRHTVTWELPKARYAVCARRTTVKSQRAIDMSNALWVGLKSILDSNNLPVYDRTTIIALKAKATNGLATDALNRFSVSCTRRLPDYLNDNESTLVATTNHALAFADIFRNSWYGANRPRNEVDWDALSTLATRIADGYGFNGVFDQQMSVWEALSVSVAAVSAFPATSGSVLSVVEDIARDTASHCFNASNIVQDSLQLSYKFNDLGTPDGVEVEYRDPDNFQQAFELYPDTSLEPEKLVLFGCTSQEEARGYAQRIWRQRLYRREFISFSTELEGHLPLIGELISVDHPILSGPTCYIVGSITPEDEVKIKIEGHKYVQAVYSARPLVNPGDPDPEPRLVTINAKTEGVSDLADIAGGYARGVTLRGYQADDVLRLTLPPGQTFVAWSPGGNPAYDPDQPDSTGAINRFLTLAGADATAFVAHVTAGGLGDDGLVWDGYEAARAGFVPVEITGATQYTFVLYDPDGNWASNTGGLSIQVEIIY